MAKCAGIVGLLIIGAGIIPCPTQAQTIQDSQHSSFSNVPTQIAKESLPPQIATVADFHTRLQLFQNCSRLMITRSGVTRTFVANPRIAEVVQFRPNELALNGLETGCTTVTLWFENASEPLIYLLEIIRPQIEASTEPAGGMSRADGRAAVATDAGQISRELGSASTRRQISASTIPPNSSSELRPVQIRAVSRPGGATLPATRYDGHAPWPEAAKRPSRSASPTGFSGDRAPGASGYRRAP